MVEILIKNGFKVRNTYLYGRGKDRAHIGTIPDGTAGGRWATTIFIDNESYLFCTEDSMNKFFDNEKRSKKLERILLSE